MANTFSFSTSSTALSPEQLRRLSGPTKSFLVPPSENVFEIDIFGFRLRDMDSGHKLFESIRAPCTRPSLETDESSRNVDYDFGPEFLSLSSLGAQIQFSVGSTAVKDFRMLERYFLLDQSEDEHTLSESKPPISSAPSVSPGKCLVEFDFSMPFCLPNSQNSWEVIYTLPDFTEQDREAMLGKPWAVACDSFYFVEGKLLMQKKARFNYCRP